MYLNPNSYANEMEFETAVKKLGGELLERARLARAKKNDDAGVVTQMPHGFDEFAPKTPKRKVLDTVDKVVEAVKQYEKEQKQFASVNDSTQMENG